MKLTLWKFILISSLSALTFNTYADWQCYANDSGGHYWTSTGTTQDRATAVALSFCSAYSPDSGSCQVSKCLTK